MLAKHGIWSEPITGLILAAAAAAAVGLGSGLVLLRTHGLTLLMLTLCTMTLLEEAANLGHDYTGRLRRPRQPAHQAVAGDIRVQPALSEDAVPLRLAVLFLCFASRAPWSTHRSGRAYGASARTCCACTRWGRRCAAGSSPATAIAAAIAGVAGGIWAQANAYVNLGTLGLDRAATVLIILVLGGPGRLYGAFVGAVAYMVLAHFLAKVYPTAWQLGLGLPAHGHRARCAQRPARPRRGRPARHRPRGPPFLAAGRDGDDGAPASPRRGLENAPCSRPAICAETSAPSPWPATSTFGSRRGPPRADRPQRSRQDHLHQSAHRGSPAHLRRGAAEGPADVTGPPRPSGSSSASPGRSRSTGFSARLSVLENVCIAVAERRGGGPLDVPPGRALPRRRGRVDASAGDVEAGRRRRAADRGTALWPTTSGRACHRARLEARGAATGRARGRGPERREPYHPRRHRSPAPPHRRAHHRPRHGPRLPVRASRSRCW